MSDTAPLEPPPQNDGDSPRDAARMVRADLVTAVFFIVFGAAILYASWTMPRLEVRRIHPLTVPGLVPGMLSIALMICGTILGLRSLKAPAPGGWQAFGASFFSTGAQRVFVVAALAFTYTLGLIGFIPFWAATMIFVGAFILVFEAWLGNPRKTLLQSLPWAIGLAVFAGVSVTLVFERLFLVRLP